MLQDRSLQNLTECLLDSPFFGSFPTIWKIRVPTNRGSIDHEVKIKYFSQVKNIVIVNFRCKSCLHSLDSLYAASFERSVSRVIQARLLTHRERSPVAPPKIPGRNRE